MDALRRIELIEIMLKESRKSLHRNSFYFILWGILLAAAGVVESILFKTSSAWLVWPIIGIVGGIISGVYSKKENESKGIRTAVDRVTNYTWVAFIFTLVFVITFSLYNKLAPHALVLMLAGSATFISGGISKFTPFIYAGILLELGALSCVFAPPQYLGYIFALNIIVGYVIPGLILRKSENGAA